MVGRRRRLGCQSHTASLPGALPCRTISARRLRPKSTTSCGTSHRRCGVGPSTVSRSAGRARTATAASSRPARSSPTRAVRRSGGACSTGTPCGASARAPSSGAALDFFPAVSVKVSTTTIEGDATALLRWIAKEKLARSVDRRDHRDRAIEDIGAIARAVERYRADGLRVAIDDFGCGNATFELRPPSRSRHHEDHRRFVRPLIADERSRRVIAGWCGSRTSSRCRSSRRASSRSSTGMLTEIGL